MAHVEFDHEPPATLTTLVMAFGGWIDAGRAATGALRHMLVDLSAERVARIESEDFFMFTQERPEVRLRPDGGRDIHWPRSEFFAWDPGDGREGLPLFCGPEPHLKWAAYAKAFLAVAGRGGSSRWARFSPARLTRAPCPSRGAVPIPCGDRSSKPGASFARRPTRAPRASPRSSWTRRSAGACRIWASWARLRTTCKTRRIPRPSKRSWATSPGYCT